MVTSFLPLQHDFPADCQQTAHLTESSVYAKSQQIIQRSGKKAREYWGRWGCLWFPRSLLAVNAVHCHQGARPFKVQYFAPSVYYLISLPIGAIHRAPPTILTFDRILPSRAYAREVL